ncbi:MAG TPA: hypothetical protein VF747_06730 [Blastocatellia bacterium]|jgi:hypothetical protein
MTLAEAISSFIRLTTQKESPSEGPPESSPQARSLAQSLELLTEYFSGTDTIDSITAERLREFLARWYVEKAGSSPTPGPHILLDSLSQFFRWAGEHDKATAANDRLDVIRELDRSIPLALEITEKLSKQIAERGGAFTFPEFLTSFEGGGQSQFDLGAPGKLGAIEGYFRILRVEGTAIEAVDTISEERVWPIIFPSAVASLIGAGFIINLELVLSSEGWQVAGCGFTYPPGAVF